MTFQMSTLQTLWKSKIKVKEGQTASRIMEEDSGWFWNCPSHSMKFHMSTRGKNLG